MQNVVVVINNSKWYFSVSGQEKIFLQPYINWTATHPQPNKTRLKCNWVTAQESCCCCYCGLVLVVVVVLVVVFVVGFVVAGLVVVVTTPTTAQHNTTSTLQLGWTWHHPPPQTLNISLYESQMNIWIQTPGAGSSCANFSNQLSVQQFHQNYQNLEKSVPALAQRAGLEN